MVFDLTRGTRSLSIFDNGMNEAKVRFLEVHSVTNMFLTGPESLNRKCKLLMERTISQNERRPMAQES